MIRTQGNCWKIQNWFEDRLSRLTFYRVVAIGKVGKPRIIKEFRFIWESQGIFLEVKENINLTEKYFLNDDL